MSSRLTIDPAKGAATIITIIITILAANGGTTPTIDPDVGIYDYEWINATVGINAPEFYLNYGAYSENVTDVLKYPYLGFSYIIEQEGSSFQAKNGSTGNIDYSGTDAATVINWAINCLKHGKVFIMAGSYEINSPILINDKSDIHLQGEGLCSKLVAGGDITVINIGTNETADASERTTISDLFIDGTAQTKLLEEPPDYYLGNCGIMVGRNSNYTEIRNCYIYNTGGNAVRGYFSGETKLQNNIFKDVRYKLGSVDVHASAEMFGSLYVMPWIVTGNHFLGGEEGIWHGDIITNNYFKGLNDTAIKGSGIGSVIMGNQFFDIEGSAIHSWAGHQVIVGNHMLHLTGSDAKGISCNGGEYLLVADNYMRDIGFCAIEAYNIDYSRFANNMIIDAGRTDPTRGAISLSDAFYNIVEDNSIYCPGAEPVAYCIREILSSDYNRVIGNVVSGAATQNILITGENSIALRNSGWVTENSGTQTLINGNTAVNVTHECDYTPSAGDISLHPIESLGSASFWWIEKITSTTFEINVNANPGQDVDFAWSINRH